MMKQPDLSFQSLSIKQMPGFEDGGFTLDDLDPCINIITGRNASGKTTTARSLCLLLWPSDDYDWPTDAAHVSGQVNLSDQEWTIEVLRDQVNYLQEGLESDQFPAPAEQTWDRYNLALHELIRTNDEGFAAQIIRESAGGYDLASAADRLGYVDGIKTRNVGEYREYRKAAERFNDVRREQEKLKEEQRRLEELERNREAALEAGQRVDVLEAAIEFREAENDLAAAREALDEYPDGLENASGDEYDRLQSLNEEIEAAERQKHAALETKETLRETVEELEIPSGGIEGTVVDDLEDRAAAIEELERRISQRREELEGYAGEARSIIEDLDPELTIEDWREVDLAAIKRLDRFAEQSEKLRAKRKVLAEKEKWLEASEEVGDPKELHQGLTTLQAWLREDGSDDASAISVQAAAAAVAITIIAGLLAYFVGLVGWVLLVLPIAFLLYKRLGPSPREDASRVGWREEEYQDLQLPQPDEWTPRSVSTLVDELYDELSKAKLEEERAQRRDSLKQTIEELDRAARELEEKRAEIEQFVGSISFVDEDAPLAYVLQKIRHFQEKDEKISGLTERIENLQRQVSEHVETISAEVVSFGHSSVTDAEEAIAAVRAVAGDYEVWESAARDLEHEEEKIEEAQRIIGLKQETRSGIYERLKIEVGELEQVKDRIEQLEAYREAEQKEYSARDRRNEARAALRRHEMYMEDLEQQPLAELQQELDVARTDAEKLDAIKDEISRIEARVEDHQTRHDLEEALAERERRLEALEELREDNLKSLVGRTLTDFIEEKTRHQSRPAVLEKADRLFRRITSGRYELVLGSFGDASFKARDTVHERIYALEELSSGTKIQLLLAVRMAFVEAQEQGIKFPLFVDEVLANSDDIRARAIIDALVEICEDGRQIFYFTAQTDEVGKWREMLQDRNVSFSVRSLSDAEPVPAVDYPSGDGLPGDLVYEVPPPESSDHAAYGEQLAVPAFDPLVHSVERMHLWYLIEDTRLLHECLIHGIDAWGALDTYLESGGRLSSAEGSDLSALRERAQVLARVLELYRRGRSKPVPPHVLEETDAVTDTFIEDVKRLLQEVEGDPEELIRGLVEGRVSGFRTAKREDLAAYLEERGYIDPDDVIPEDELRARIQAITSQYDTVHAGDIERVLNRF